MAELVADEVVAGPLERLAEEDRVPGRVAVEAAEPGEAEQKRPHEHTDVVDLYGFGVELQAVEAGLGPPERVACWLSSHPLRNPHRGCRRSRDQVPCSEVGTARRLAGSS